MSDRAGLPPRQFAPKPQDFYVRLTSESPPEPRKPLIPAPGPKPIKSKNVEDSDIRNWLRSCVVLRSTEKPSFNARGQCLGGVLGVKI